MLNSGWSRSGGEERTEEYRTWRTLVGFGSVCDTDQIEYDPETGRPLALFELCVADPRSVQHPFGVLEGQEPSPAFFDACIAKVSKERPQGRLLRHVAEALGIPLVLVVYVSGKLRQGMWTHRIGSEGWNRMGLPEFQARLCRLYVQHRGTTNAT